MTKAFNLAAPILVAAAIVGCTEQAEVNFPTEPGNYVTTRDGLLIFRAVYPDGKYFEDRQSRQDPRRLETCGVAATSRLSNGVIELFVPNPAAGCHFTMREPFSIVE